MEYIQMPEFPKLQGEEAIVALRDLIEGLEEERGEGLTDKQTKALIRFSQGLISSIEAERQSKQLMNKLEKVNEGTRFIRRLKKRLQRRRGEG